MSRPLIALLGLFGLAAPLLLSDFWTFIAIEIMVFALYATSFNLLLGYGGMLSFGHAAFFGVGAYTTALLIKKVGVPFGLALLGAPLAAAVVAALVGYFSVRRSGIYFAMLTFAFQMLLYTIALKAGDLTGGDDGVTGIRPTGPLRDPTVYYYFSLLLVAAAHYLLWRLTESPFGYALRALRSNSQRLQYVGVPIRRHQWLTFVIAGGFAGLAGGLFALSTGSVFPGWLDWTASATPVVMAVLGGLHSFFGPMLGAAVYVILEVVISGHTEYWPLAMGTIIVLLVLLLPEGLTGWVVLRQRWRRRVKSGAP